MHEYEPFRAIGSRAPAYSYRVDPESFANVFSAIAAAIALVAGYIAIDLAKRRGGTQPEPRPLEDLLQQLTANAVEAGRLASLVQVEIQAQLAEVAKLRKEATEAEQLAALNGAAAEAVAAQFKAVVASESRKSTRVSIWSGVLFFVAGVAASIFVTLLVRPIGA